MEPTQSFRLAGTTDILDIPCDQDDGQSVIYWDDLLEVFPSVQYIKNGNAVVKKLKDHGPDGNKPVRIKHYPGVVLDVVLSTSTHTTGGSAALSMITSMTLPGGGTNNAAEPVPEPVAGLDVIKNGQVSTLTADGYDSVQDISSVVSISASGSQVTSLSIEKDSTAVLSLKQVVALSQTEQHGSVSEGQMVSSGLSDIQAQVLNSSDMHGWIAQAVQNGQVERLGEQLMGCLQGLKNEMTKNNEFAAKNNELVSQVKELALENKEMASKNNDLASKNNDLASSNNEMSLRLTESTAVVIKLQEQFNVKQDEMKKLQIQALDQLSLLQSRVQALMNQTYELHEYPIPRLFVVLPQNTSSWNPKDWVSNNFRLYFLCECGDHTRRSTSKIPHHIHLAKHEGYEITRPKEFFQQYGNYVLTILKMLKFGVSVAGVAVPAVTLLVRADVLDRATSSLKMLIGNLQEGMEQTIGCLEKATADNDGPRDGGPRDGPRDRASHQMENNEALEGADLRKLETFLKNKDRSKVLGNLYRTTTSEGHVKWVCIDHYRENYHEKTSKAFRDTVESMGGSFDENIGRVSVHIRSKIQVDQFYGALEKAKWVFELEIGLDWGTAYNDFKKLRDCLIKTNVGAVHINLHRQDVPASDILNRGKRHDPILEIMQHPSTHSVSIVGAPGDFIRRSSLLSRNGDFSNLKTMEIDLMDYRKDIPGLKSMISKMSNLSKLIMNDSGDKVNHICGVCGATEPFQGSLNVDEDRVNVYVRSRLQAELVSLMLETSKSFYGLAIDLQLDLNGFSTDTTPERTQRHDSVFNVMQNTSTCSAVIIGAPSDFIQRSNLLSTNGNFPSIENLRIDVSALKYDISGLRTMVSKMPKLVCVKVSESENRNHHVCGACDAMESWEEPFKVDGNRVKIDLGSRIQAEMVHKVLETTTSVHGLGVDLCVELEDSSIGDNTDRIRGHDSIFDIMRHPSTQSVMLVQPPGDLIRQSSLLSKNDHFPHLKRLEMDLCMLKEDPSGIKSLLSRIPNHTCVRMKDSRDMNTQIQVGHNPMDSSEEPIDGNSNGAKIHLGSIALRELTDELLAKSKGAQEVDICLYWNADESDFARLRDGLVNTQVNGVKLYANVDDSSDDGESTRIQHNNALFDMMGHPSIDSVTLIKPPNRKASRCDDFSNLKDLNINLSSIKEDISTLKYLLSKAYDGSLTFQGYVDDLLLVGLYRSITEYHMLPIIFTFRKRRIPSSTASHQSFSGHQCQSHLLSLVSIQMDRLVLRGEAEEEAAVDILVKLERGATGLMRLSLKGSFEERGDEFFKKVASVISRHKVDKLEFDVGGTKEEGAVRMLSVLEGDQWKHIRSLEIWVHKVGVGTGAMKALVEGRDKMHGPVELDYFYLDCPYSETMSSKCAALCKSFVASTSIKKLYLYVDMTPSDTESVLISADMSRLEVITLRAKGHSSSEVDRVLDCLTNAHNLREVSLYYYTPTQEQKKRMEQRGVQLRGLYNNQPETTPEHQ